MDNKELNELKNIFEFLSKSKNFTEDAIKKYKEALELSKSCYETLKKAELVVKVDE